MPHVRSSKKSSTDQKTSHSSSKIGNETSIGSSKAILPSIESTFPGFNSYPSFSNHISLSAPSNLKVGSLGNNANSIPINNNSSLFRENGTVYLSENGVCVNCYNSTALLDQNNNNNFVYQGFSTMETAPTQAISTSLIESTDKKQRFNSSTAPQKPLSDPELSAFSTLLMLGNPGLQVFPMNTISSSSLDRANVSSSSPNIGEIVTIGELISLNENDSSYSIKPLPQLAIKSPSTLSPTSEETSRVQCQCGKSSYYMYAPKTSIPSPPRCVSKRCPCFASDLNCSNCKCRFCENPHGVNTVQKGSASSSSNSSSKVLVSPRPLSMYTTPSPGLSKKILKKHKISNGGDSPNPPPQVIKKMIEQEKNQHPPESKLSLPSSSPSSSSSFCNILNTSFNPPQKKEPNQNLNTNPESVSVITNRTNNGEINWVTYRFNKPNNKK